MRKSALTVLAWMGAVFYVGMGLTFFLKSPNLLAGVTYTSANGLSAVQSVFAGLSIGVGMAVVILAWHRLYALSVLVSVCVTSGLAMARLYSMVVDHAFTGEQWTHFSLEMIGVVIGLMFQQELKAALDFHRQARSKR